MKKALVFGSCGQAGSYLVELLEEKGYKVSAPSRDALNFETEDFWWRLEDRIRWFQPDEIYNFAAKMYAPDSWKRPIEYMQVNGMAVVQILNAITRWCPKAKFFNAGSAEVFDKKTWMQNEWTERKPTNPYGVAKHLAEEAVRIYRSQGLFACTGIYFNMESPRRQGHFFTQKVVREVVRVSKELALPKVEKIKLGKLSARRDWGWAPEYVEVAWSMLQMHQPEDFVIGTGERHTCKEFVEEAFRVVKVNPWNYLEYDDTPGEDPDSMLASTAQIEHKLGWKAKYKFKDVVRMLVEAELANTTSNS